MHCGIARIVACVRTSSPSRFATEAQEEKWNRDLETIATIKANVPDPVLNNLLITKILIEMGVIPNV